MEETVQKNKKRNRIIIIVVICLVVLGIIGLIVYLLTRQTNDDSGSVEVISKRNIETAVYASGVVDSVDSEAVSSSLIGSKITKVYVKEGEQVTPGQVVCQLDTTDLQKQYVELQKSIAQAKADKFKTNQEYDKAIADAQNERNVEISELQGEISVAQANYNSATDELNKQGARYLQYLSDPNHSEWDEEAIEMENHIYDLQSSQEVNKYKIDIYQNNLDSIVNGDDGNTGNDEIRDGINKLSDSTIATMEETAAELAKSIGESSVRCTVGGVITSVSAKVGESYVGGPICTVEDVNSLMVYGQVDETYVADVSPGMKVKVKTDSTGDQILKGVVTFVAPRAKSTSTSGDAGSALGASLSLSMGTSGNYIVKVALDEQNPRLRLGMNAKLYIITSESLNTLSVPNGALQEDKDGKFVEIVTNMDQVQKDENTPYKKEKVKVEEGVIGTFYTGVRGEGLEEGAYVYIPDTTTEDIMNWLESVDATIEEAQSERK